MLPEIWAVVTLSPAGMFLSSSSSSSSSVVVSVTGNRRRRRRQQRGCYSSPTPPTTGQTASRLHNTGSARSPVPPLLWAQLKQSLFAFTRHTVTIRWNINHEIIKTIHKNIKTSRQENKTSIHTPRLFSGLVSSTASKTFWCQERYFSEDDSLKWKNVCVVSPQREKPHRAVYKSINQQWETDGVTEDNHVLWSGD